MGGQLHTLPWRPDYVALAKCAVGNWKRFLEDWDPDFTDTHLWCVVIVSHTPHGSPQHFVGLAIEETLEPFRDDVEFEQIFDGSYLYGTKPTGAGLFNAVCVRVYDGDGTITEAFKTLCDAQDAFGVDLIRTKRNRNRHRQLALKFAMPGREVHTV